ncbi:MAG: ROK family protein [Verrucomicrobiota bacterium]
MNFLLGIDLGGSSVKAVAVTPEGQTLFSRNTEFEPDEHMDWAEKIRGIIQSTQGELGNEPMAIGLSAPGLAARDGRSISHLPGRLHGLVGLHWTEFLQTKRPVPVLNDAHAALLGEVWLGAARGFENVIMLTLGTGVGGAAMVDGRLLRGHHGKAGHLGHTSLDPDGLADICATPGSLEMAMGNCTIEARSNGRFQSTHALIAAHLAGDTEASKIWLKSVKALAAAISTFTNVLDPEAVIVGGGIARSGSALFDPLRIWVREMEWQTGEPVKILPAELGELAGAYGAAWNALNT